MTTLSTPSSVDLSITCKNQRWSMNYFVLFFYFFPLTCFMQGISISTPSRPNLFSAVHFFARKASKPMDLQPIRGQSANKSTNQRS